MRDTESVLRRSLATRAGAYEPGDLAEAERLFLRKRSRRRAFRAGAAGALAAASVVAVFALVQPEVVSDREQRPQPAGLRVASRFAIPEEPLAIAGDAHGIWVASRQAGIVSRIDPATGEITEVELEGASELTVASDDVWAAGSDRLVEIDAATGGVGAMVIDWPDAIDMAAAGGRERPVWVVTSSGCTADVTDLATEPTCVGPADFHATDVATSANETWLLDGDAGVLNQVHAEPGVNEGRSVVDGEAPVVGAPTGRYADLLITTAGNDALWVSGDGGQLMRLDLVTGEKVTTQLDGDYADLAEGYNSVWALVGHEGSDRGELVAIDVATGQVTGNPYSLSGKPSDLAAVEDGVWVTLRESNEVVRMTDPDRAPAPVETAQPTASPDDRGTDEAGAVMVFSKGGDIWSSDANGTLRQLTDTDVGELKPAFTQSIFNPQDQAILFQRGRGNSAGSDLVYLDLSTLEESGIAEGAWATFYPDGTGAWLTRGGSQPVITVAPLFSEPILTFPVVGTSDPYSVGPIAWDQSRQSLFYAISERNGPQIYQAEAFSAGGSPLEDIEPQRLDVDGLGDGDVLVAPATSFSDGVDVIRLSEPSPSLDEGSHAGVELGTVDLSGAGPVYEPLVDLSDLPFAMDVAPRRISLTNAGVLDATVREDGSVSWSRGAGRSWLVGDGFRLFLVDAGGAVQELPWEAGLGAAVSFDYLPRD